MNAAMKQIATLRPPASQRGCPPDASVSPQPDDDQESQPDGPGLENVLGPLLLAAALFWTAILGLILLIL